MRKFAVVALLILAGIGAWAASTTHARVEIPVADNRIDPFQMMLNARDLPTEHYLDYTEVFSQ
jgi:hypothetical protein